ncbi:TetR/AcrR family transcriptional regulator [Methanobacterium sp.]|uniref:TetR/AcrR family transcriptional regulator n=1 Tax=Methanobacterium sp. TaxID=2164 RepID=UPI003C76B550
MNDIELKIIDAALKIFSSEGYRNATTKAIADEAGVNESTLFRKFKNKENLFDSVIASNRSKVDKELDLLLSKNDNENPRKSLDFILNSICKVMKNNYELLRILIHENSRIKYGTKIDMFSMIIVKHLQPFKYENDDINLEILAVTIFSFFFVVHYKNINTNITETINMDEQIVYNHFKEYCARIIQI